MEPCSRMAGFFAQEWLGSLYTLWCFTETSEGDLKAQVRTKMIVFPRINIFFIICHPNLLLKIPAKILIKVMPIFLDFL